MSLALTKKSLSLLECTGIRSKKTNVQPGKLKKKQNSKVKNLVKTLTCNDEEKINQLFMLSNSNMKEEIAERLLRNIQNTNRIEPEKKKKSKTVEPDSCFSEADFAKFAEEYCPKTTLL